MDAYLEALKQCEDSYSFIKDMASQVTFNYFHTQSDEANGVKCTSDMLNSDPFIKSNISSHDNKYFPANGPVLRGCIAVTTDDG